MKHLFVIFAIWGTYVQAQNSDCYELIVKGSILSNATLKWSDVKVSAPKDKLVNFLRTDKLFAACNYIFQTPDQILSQAKKVDCTDIIRLEFKEPKDVLQLGNELKKKSPNGNKKPEDIKTTDHSAPKGSAEMCLSSDGSISLSFGNEFGSIQVTSKGEFSVSTKGNGTEYKVGL